MSGPARRPWELTPPELLLAASSGTLCGAVLYPLLLVAWQVFFPAAFSPEVGLLSVSPRPAPLLLAAALACGAGFAWRATRRAGPARPWLTLEEKCRAVTALAGLGLFAPFWAALGLGFDPPRDPTLPMLATTSGALVGAALAFWPRLVAALVTGLFGGGVGVVAGYVGGALLGGLLALGLRALGAPEPLQQGIGGAVLVGGALLGVLIGLRVFGLICDLD